MNNDLISRSELKKELSKRLWFVSSPECDAQEIIDIIDNATTVEIPVARWDCYCEGQKVGYEKALSERPQDESISLEDGLKKARRGNYVIYDVDFLLDNLAREVNIMESARQLKAGKGNDND